MIRVLVSFTKVKYENKGELCTLSMCLCRKKVNVPIIIHFTLYRKT